MFALVPITLFNRFISAGRRARRHRRAAEAAIFQHDIDLYGRIAAAIENLASVNIEDRSHGGAPVANGGMIRSEENTSEIQSQMRISYAVFCLKQKKYKSNTKMS